MSVELEWQASAASIDLPPLRTSSTSFFSNQPRAETPLHAKMFRSETPVRASSPTSRLTASRIDQFQMEGKPLGLPSEEQRDKERRHASPRGMRAFVLGRGETVIGRGIGDEIWRIRRNKEGARPSDMPLAPIEATLRKRKMVQSSMSAPVLPVEPEATATVSRKTARSNWTPYESMRVRENREWHTNSFGMSEWHSRKKLSQQLNRTCMAVLQQSDEGAASAPSISNNSWYASASSSRFKSQDLGEPSVQSSQTLLNEGSTLVQSCIKLCDWEESLNSSATPSFSSRIPAGVKPSGATTGATSSTWVPSTKTASPSKAASRRRPAQTELLSAARMPGNVLERIKSCGWIQKDLGEGVWVEQGRHLTASRSAAPAAAGCRVIDERFQLLQLLEKQAIPQGPEALRAALKWRCGSLEQAYSCLCVGDRSEERDVSLLEFVGAMALLGLDALSLSGGSEAAAFSALDGDKDGRLSLHDLLGETAPAPSWCELSGTNHSGGEAALDERSVSWILIAKFVALSSWFSIPLLQRHRLRPGCGEAATPLYVDRPATGLGGALTVVTALAMGATGVSCHQALKRQQLPDAVRQCWTPGEGDLEEVENQMKTEFKQNSSVKQFNEALLNKADFFRLLGDLPPVGIGYDPEPRRLRKIQVGAIYDEVLAGQVRSTGQMGAAISKGLTFDSLRIALLKTSLLMGLHFRHIVEDALDAQVPTP